MSGHRYPSDILNGSMPGQVAASVDIPEVEAVPGLVVVHRATRFRGAVVRVERDGAVVLRSSKLGAERLFTMRSGAFAVDGETSTLIRPRPRPATAPGRTASGSVTVKPGRAQVAKPSRILVEGVHDAELVEKVWGDDLRAEGIVVQPLDGVDVLPEWIRVFQPCLASRLGVLVDHLVDGSKESHLATSIRHPHVRITGTPYVDIWQAVRPSVLGIEAWPVIPRGQSWKQGVCDAFGEPVPARFWRQLLGTVTTYADLEPALVGAVESLIDFVTAGA